MRWNSSGVSFSRPIRWLTALFDGIAVPFQYAGLTAGRVTRGLRFSSQEEYELKDIPDYFSFLKSQGIMADIEARKAEIEKQVESILASVNATPALDSGLLDEVNNLVEAPTALMGNFNKEHLALPGEVLVGVMKKHQRYFPVKETSDKLMPHFITVRNGGKEHLDTVARGNEEVIQARFADAPFSSTKTANTSLRISLPGWTP